MDSKTIGGNVDTIKKIVTAYTDEHELPTASVNFLESGTIFGFIPFTGESIEQLHEVEPLLQELDGEDVEDHFQGAREYYVRYTNRVISYYQEEKEIGFIIYKIA